MENSLIRNFCIIAHIDHGKSTLADRFLEHTDTITRGGTEQVLDSMELERERGITIKAKAVRLVYKAQDGREYVFNLVDTPGHVDFAYEVAKSLEAVEAAILLVDASQGVEAQTVANFYLAFEKDLYIIPVANKIDLPHARLDETKHVLMDMFDIDPDSVLGVSAKTGEGISQVLERVVAECPPPRGSADQPLRAYVFDSMFDVYRGVVLFVRVLEGQIKPGDQILIVNKGKKYTVEDLGVFRPAIESIKILEAGEIGAVFCNIRDPHEVVIPDYMTHVNAPTSMPTPPGKKMQPMVFCGIFPPSPTDHDALRDAIDKLRLQDASFEVEPDNMGVLGFGFRCGFLGMLHMEIIHERLRREFGLDVILTSPNVRYQLTTKRGEELIIDDPGKFPPVDQVEEVREPFVRAHVITPIEFMQTIHDLVKERRGFSSKNEYLGSERMSLEFEIPLQEVISNFYDCVKSVTKGYGSLDYEFIGFRPNDIIHVEILFNKKPSGIFSFLVHREKADAVSRKVLKKLREFVPRHMFEVNMQAVTGARVIASEKIAALKKDVTAKCYGGDISRKRKLWEKQKEGKKKMKQLGDVQIPPRAFREVLKI
jgi:GTP-binding protein LepA